MRAVNRTASPVRSASPKGDLLVRGIVRSAGEAMDRDIVHLAVLAVHQHRSALPTLKIDGVTAGIEDRRRANGAADERCGHEFEAMARMRVHCSCPR